MDNKLIIRNNSIFDFKCNKKKNRIKISNFNKEYINYSLDNNNIFNIEKYIFNDDLINLSFLNNNLNYNNNYNDYLIYENTNFKFKNYIYILNNSFKCDFNELIFNKHYKIFGNNLNYKYTRNLDNIKLSEINYIIFYNDNELINNNNYLNKINKNKFQNLEKFLNEKIIILQIGYPEFKFPINFKNFYNTWDINKLWNVKLNKYLSHLFIQNNFNYIIYLTFNLIYSYTSKTDLLRHLFLYKYGGLYVDLSIKLLDKSFINLLTSYDFITANEKLNHKTFLNGLLYSKNKHNNISTIFIQEIIEKRPSKC